MSEQGFGDLGADAHDRVEGGHGLLEDHGDGRAAQFAEFVGLGRVAKIAASTEE